MTDARTKWVVTTAAAAVAALLLVAAWAASSSTRVAWLAQMGRSTLTEAERRALFDEMFSDVGTLYDAVPEPDVARIGRRNHVTTLAGAEVRTNGSGFRDDEEWTPRDPERYRVVCLGDSMVFGQGGPVEDRFCDQLEAWYADHGITVDGRPVETLAAGIPGWTLVQSTTWLDRRLSDLDPDLVIVLTMPNDITDASGVTGVGTITRAFSPQTRRKGSGVFSNEAGVPFGSAERSALTMDVGPESRQRWTRAVGSLAKLLDDQRARGGEALLAVMAFDPLFTEIYKGRLERADIDAPLVLTNFFPSEGNRLVHDPHPDRVGHRILAHHLIHALHTTSLIEVPEPDLPQLHPSLEARTTHPFATDTLTELRRQWFARHLRPKLSFDRLGPAAAPGLLGGVLPDERGGPPWASIRAGWLMSRPADSTQLRVAVAVPDLPELLPITLTLSVDGNEVGQWEVTEASQRHELVATLPEGGHTRVVEVVLDASRYVATLSDDRMRSVQLLDAELH